MTLEQIKQLSDDEIRIKVAELLGWLEIENDMVVLNVYELRGLTPDNTHIAHERWRISIPQYPKDLNACFEMEEILTDIQFCKYVQILCGHTTIGVKIQWGGPDAGRACRATARKRCEAFILTMTGENDHV